MSEVYLQYDLISMHSKHARAKQKILNIEIHAVNFKHAREW